MVITGLHEFAECVRPLRRPRTPDYAWATLDPATLAAILTSLGIGGLLGAWAKAWHERTEKFRDLTIEACVAFLDKDERAQRELRSAQVVLLANPPAENDEGVLEQLVRGREAWRELQTQFLRISLLLPGGRRAPAVRDARAIVILYHRWLESLADLADRRASSRATEAIAGTYADYAIGFHVAFTRHANEAIRATLRSGRSGRRLRRDTNQDDFERRLADLDNYAASEREHHPVANGPP